MKFVCLSFLFISLLHVLTTIDGQLVTGSQRSQLGEDPLSLFGAQGTASRSMCGVPPIENGVIRLIDNQDNDFAPFQVTIDTQIGIVCNVGYVLTDGPRVAICNPPGIWSNALGQCVLRESVGRRPPRPPPVVTCPVPIVENGRITSYGIGSGSQEVALVPSGAMIALICDGGYRLSGGTRTSACTFTGQWSSTLGRCVETATTTTLAPGASQPTTSPVVIPNLPTFAPPPPKPISTGGSTPGSNLVTPSAVLAKGDKPDPTNPLICGQSTLFGQSSRSNRTVNPKIYGGTQSPAGAVPWMARFEVIFAENPSDQQIFGGTLLSPKWVLTTANRFSGKNIDQGSVIFGSNLMRSTDFRPVESRIKQVIVHPAFSDDMPFSYNFAMVELATPLSYSKDVLPICLPDSPKGICDRLEYDPDATTIDGCSNVVAAGWGLTESSTVFPNELRHVNVSVVPFNACKQVASDLTEFELCAGGANDGRDTCLGDNGGPLMCRSEDRFYLVGVTSSAGSHQCATTGVPTIYGRVCSVLTWIRDIMARP